MQIFRLRSRFQSDSNCYVNWQLYMPRIICPAKCSCGGRRATEHPGFSYPAADFENSPSVRKSLQPVEIPLAQWRQLKAKVLAALPYDVTITPGTVFGRKVAEISGTIAPFYFKRPYPLATDDILNRLEVLGVRDLFPVPIAVKSKRKILNQLLELQIEHTVSLAGKLDVEGQIAKMKKSGITVSESDYRCSVCGRNQGLLPVPLVLRGSSIPDGVSVFRLCEKPTEIFCNDLFADATEKLKLPNIILEPVKTDGSEKKVGFSRVTRSRPEAWPFRRKSKGTRGLPKKATRRRLKPRPTQVYLVSDLLARTGLGKEADAIKALVRPAIRFVLNYEDKLPVGSSRFGGLPDLPKGTQWPGTKKAPLDFLLQLNLREIGAQWADNPFPKSGFIWFFYDTDQCPYGYDPKDKSGWRVLFSTCNDSELVTGVSPLWISDDGILPSCSLQHAVGDSLPAANSLHVSELKLNHVSLKAYKSLVERLRKPGKDEAPIHKLWGYPDTIQDDVEAACAMASAGFDAMYQPDPTDTKQLNAAKKAKDWQLLLQLDTDPDAQTEWADSGRLYFLIRQQDLAANRFHRCWAILQTY